MNETWEIDIRNAKETMWLNDKLVSFEEIKAELELSKEDIEDASRRLERFAPLIMRLFPETEAMGGIIESKLLGIEHTRDAILENINNDTNINNSDIRLLLKCDSHLPIAGSVKARGGIYEVLKHTEELAINAGIINENDDYSKLADHKAFFSNYTIQVGSTGNLGMSIGIMSAAIGYKAIVHMSSDAKQWKKELLREKGVIVKEYASDYSKAVCEGRRLSDEDPSSYFVDDEHSKDLFLGYSVAGERLKKQMDDMGIVIDSEHPLFVYIPCGVGGAPGGISFGLKHIWGDNVHCFFVEPTEAPCMFVAMASEKGDEVAVSDYGLSGKTEADGLAVGRASQLVYKMMKNVIDGIITVKDERLFRYMRDLAENDNIIIEPSACAAFAGFEDLGNYLQGDWMAMKDLKSRELYDGYKNAVHIVWATGGSFMPEEIVRENLGKAED